MNTITEWIAFGGGSILLLAGSRRALTHWGSHGSYRFVAWEAMLALLVLNISVWGDDPLSAHQIVSWILLAASIVPVAAGARALWHHGALDRRREDPTLFRYEKTTRLVTTGAYRYIRHPLYGSLLLLAWGIFFKRIGLLTAVLVAVATVFLTLTARADERECVTYFGPDYADYMKRTKMFIPFVW